MGFDLRLKNICPVKNIETWLKVILLGSISPTSCLQWTEASSAHLRVCLIVKLLRPDPSAHQVIPDSMSQGKVVIPGCCNVPVLDQGEVQVAVETLLQLGHILHTHDASDADLLALFLVCERFGHGGGAGCAVLQVNGVVSAAELKQSRKKVEEAFTCRSPLLLLLAIGGHVGGCFSGRPLLRNRKWVNRETTVGFFSSFANVSVKHLNSCPLNSWDMTSALCFKHANTHHVTNLTLSFYACCILFVHHWHL